MVFPKSPKRKMQVPLVVLLWGAQAIGGVLLTLHYSVSTNHIGKRVVDPNMSSEARETMDEAEVILETPRLRLQRLRLCDWELIVGVFGTKEFKEYVGDRGIRTREDAEEVVASPFRVAHFSRCPLMLPVRLATVHHKECLEKLQRSRLRCIPDCSA
jgi:hypothetical protein